MGSTMGDFDGPDREATNIILPTCRSPGPSRWLRLTKKRLGNVVSLLSRKKGNCFW